MKLKILPFLPAALWFILIFILLTLPASDIPSYPFLGTIYFDKWVHIGLFMVLVVLTCLPLLKTRAASASLFWEISLCALCYGITMEFVQKYFTQGRAFEIMDMVADGVGSAIGCILVIKYRKRNLQKETSDGT